MTGTRGFRNPKNWSQDWTGRSIKKKNREGKVKVRTGIKVGFKIKNQTTLLLIPIQEFSGFKAVNGFFNFQ
jgi:hypothetical protein